jgi:hypothetical protein
MGKKIQENNRWFMITNNIKNSIVKTIKTLYPSYDVWDETVEQGLVEPCSFVKLINQNVNKEINKFGFTLMFCVQYLLDKNTENMQEQYINMAEVLYEKLNIFPDVSGGYIIGTNMRHEIDDYKLSFYVDVKIKTKLQKIDETKMDKLKELIIEVHD